MSRLTGCAINRCSGATSRRRAGATGFTAFNQAIPPSLPAALPTVTYADAMTLHFDGETVQVVRPPNAHTDSDTLVHFKRARHSR